MRRLGMALLLALSACKPTIVIEVEEPRGEGDETSPPIDPLVEREAVREAVRAYAIAMHERDVEAAVDLVVADTFDLYESLRVAALRAEREQLERLDMMRVILVLQIRSHLTRAELESLDGRGLFRRAVVDGLVVAELAELTLEEVWVDETATHAQIRVDDEPVLWLRKTDAARWRIDIPQMIREFGPTIEAITQEQVLAHGKVATAAMIAESDDPAILDGPREGEPGDAP
jgi:hypothetical protein